MPAEVTIGPSSIAGSGVFAATALAAGDGVGADLPLNHSCDPNLWWTAGALATCHVVEIGEELTYDYATSTSDPEFLLRCHCQTYRCRGIVTGDDWRIPQLQRRYAGHWTSPLQRLIDGAES